ncbi:MAG: glycosyltransferase family 4 protein [Carnobacterium sp.]|nr:glycosyltransferase family 4 protein [Carnobacterium sp.]
MKIVHLCLGSFYPDNFSYQENMLPKFHKEQGHDVEVIASLFTFDKNGKGTYIKNGSSYRNEYDILVTRLNYKHPLKVYRKLKRYVGTLDAIKKSAPDILFIHGCQFMDMDIVVEFLKQRSSVKVYVDNHADFSNSATNFLSKNILHKIIWKHTSHIIEPYTTKFYGVLPARVDFLKNIYKLPPEKCELLVMGADDSKIKETLRLNSRERIRERYNISPDEFLVMTGGKIDIFKTQTLLLMEAVKNMTDSKVKLIVFGSVTPELKEKVNSLCYGLKVQYIGWVESDLSYQYFSAADLVVFPGRHSVFWEQVTGMGIPMVCKYWQGTTHVDIGGNVVFLKEDSVKEIQTIIEELSTNQKKYNIMKTVAMGEGKQRFLYSEIAKNAILTR